MTSDGLFTRTVFHLNCLLTLIPFCFGTEVPFEKQMSATLFNGNEVNLKEMLIEMIEISEKQNKRILTLEATVKKLAITVDKMEEKYSEQRRINTFLESRLAGVDDAVPADVEPGFEELSNDVRLKQSEVSNEPAGDNVLRNVSGKEGVISNHRIKTLQNPVKQQSRSRRFLDTEPVAFSAYADHSLLHVSAGDTVIFNQVLYNSGGEYDPTTGRFTALETGVYFFSFTIHSQKTETNMQLVLDGNNVVGAVTHADSSGLENNMATNSAVIHISAGQSVWIKAVYDHDAELISSPGFRQVTFSGFLLF